MMFSNYFVLLLAVELHIPLFSFYIVRTKQFSPFHHLLHAYHLIYLHVVHTSAFHNPLTVAKQNQELFLSRLFFCYGIPRRSPSIHRRFRRVRKQEQKPQTSRRIPFPRNGRLKANLRTSCLLPSVRIYYGRNP